MIDGLEEKNWKLFPIPNKNGFTLVEVIVSIAIFVIMMGAIVTFFITIYREQAADFVRIKRINTASQAIKKMSSEIRKINRGEDGSTPIEFGGEQSLIFYSDVDDDGLTERVDYYLSGTNLIRILTEPTGDPYEYNVLDRPSSPEPAEIVATRDVQNGSNLIFRYYDKNYTGSEDSLSLLDPPLDPSSVNITEIKLIEINLDINPDNNYLTQPFQIKTKIHPRNLKEY